MKNKVKICINCKHHGKDDHGIIVCCHKKLKEYAGKFSVRMLREMGNSLQNEMTNNCFPEICGKRGEWYEGN